MNYLFVYRNSTDAQSARRILLRHGINATVTKAPVSADGRGCLPAVRVSDRSLSAAKMLLAQQPWDHICRIGDEGKCTEIV